MFAILHAKVIGLFKHNTVIIQRKRKITNFYQKTTHLVCYLKIVCNQYAFIISSSSAISRVTSMMSACKP